MTYLSEKIKPQMRVSAAQTAFDSEITDIIASARADLKLSGILTIKADSETDPLITRAVSLYCKANFGWDNKDAEKFQASYESLKAHLTLSQEYTMLTVTFTVKVGITPLPDAVVIFNGEEKITNSLGVATFIGLRVTQNMKYSVALDGYKEIESEVDVDASAAIAVSMMAVV